MFSRYQKSQPPKPAEPTQAAFSLAPTPDPENTHGVSEMLPPQSAIPAASVKIPPPPADPKAPTGQTKHRERLDELKTEMHHRLLENLNLSALETAKELRDETAVE